MATLSDVVIVKRFFSTKERLVSIEEMKQLPPSDRQELATLIKANPKWPEFEVRLAAEPFVAF